MIFMKKLALLPQMHRKQKNPILLLLALLTAWSCEGLIALQKVQAQQTLPFCQSPSQAILQKNTLRQQSLGGDRNAQQQYQSLILRDAQSLQQCRSQSWLKTQAIWLRLYECDLQPGVLESVLDRIVSRGYNQVYLEVFYSGQVLLPPAENRTAWPSVVRNPALARRDLLAEAIQKAQARGLKAYAWMFSLNYGYSYGNRADRVNVLARNGFGKTSLNVVDTTNKDIDISKGETDKVFVDPYNPQARQDYALMLQSVLQRRPSGVLFDYIRYPRQTGGASITSKLPDLWIFGGAARQTLISRATNAKGGAVIEKYLSQGNVTGEDLAAIDRSFPGEGEPQWQGRVVPAPTPGKPLPPVAVRLPRLQQDLWLLSVAHAYQGVVDFLNAAVVQANRQGAVAGAVFFPDGNRRLGQGFDSRMQPWDQFSPTIEWHPMSYGICGDTSCIVEQALRVISQAPPGTKVSPVIAGAWSIPAYNRPSLEMQMNAIHQAAPQVTAISHFDFSWQEPSLANARRACKLNLIEAAATQPLGIGR
jgi:Glycosyl hydrolase-like 10